MVKYGSKQAEYRRTAELLVEIMDRDSHNGPYFLVALLYDSQYGHKDLGELLHHLKEHPRGRNRPLNALGSLLSGIERDAYARGYHDGRYDAEQGNAGEF